MTDTATKTRDRDRWSFRTTTPPEYQALAAEHAPDTVCGGCYETFATLAEVFSHECLASTLAGRAAGALTDVEDHDAPPRFPEKPGRREAARGTNQYPGPCTRCGATVEPFKGTRSKVAGRWTVTHLACPEGAPATPQPVPEARPVKVNRYEAPCARCGVLVASGAGSLRNDAGRWLVEHVGPCPERPAPEVIVAEELPHVPEGHYAVPSTGTNDLAFYRVDRGTGAYAGRVFVKAIVGGRPAENVPRSHVPGILARIAADPEAGPRYGREIGRCCRCNRHLTDEASRLAGIGPDCATRD